MKKVNWLKRLVLSLGMLGLLMLTGCPRAHSQEEIDAIKKKADECLAEALETHCGLKTGSYEILSSEFDYRGYPQPAKTYQIRVGEENYQAVVFCDGPYETYTNYNSAGFEDVLKEYLKEKFGEPSELQAADFEVASVDFWPTPIYYFVDPDMKDWRLLPASVKPEGYADYLKQCQEKDEIQVDVTIDCYGEIDLKALDGAKLFGERGRKFPYYGMLQDVVIEHYGCSADAVSGPADLIESCEFYRIYEHAGDDEFKKLSVYEYVEVGDGFLIRGVKQDDATLSATIKDGYIYVTPGAKKYDIFSKAGREGAVLRNGITQDCRKENAAKRNWKKSDRYDSWWYVDKVVGWYILPFEE